jgi:tetratricopeptide (TPR) repeat protein
MRAILPGIVVLAAGIYPVAAAGEVVAPGGSVATSSAQASPSAPAPAPSPAGPAPSSSAGTRQGQSSSPSPDEDPAYHFLLGRHLEDQGRIDAALAAFKRAIALRPDSAELRAELAAHYARQEKASEAVDAARDALKYDANNREANRILGSVYASMAEQHQPLKPGDDVTEYASIAIAALERARRDGIVDTGLDLMLGRLYVNAGLYDKAVSMLSSVLVDQPGYPEAVWLLAHAHERAGRIDKAIETLEAGDPFYRGELHLAELYEQQHRWKEAADAYAEAQALNTRAPDLSLRRAAALINAGDAATARDLLQPVVARTARPDPAALYLLAEAQRSMKDLTAAESTIRKLRELAPDDVRGLYVLAQVLDDKHDLAGAERALRDIIARDPLDATALNYLGYMFAEHGTHLDEAVDLVQRALKVEPANPSFLDSLGWAYFQQGRLDQADPPLSEAATKLPSNSAVQDHLGDLRFRQQRYEDAAAAWERSLAGDGDSIDRTSVEKKLRDARARVPRVK